MVGVSLLALGVESCESEEAGAEDRHQQGRAQRDQIRDTDAVCGADIIEYVEYRQYNEQAADTQGQPAGPDKDISRAQQAASLLPPVTGSHP